MISAYGNGARATDDIPCQIPLLIPSRRAHPNLRYLIKVHVPLSIEGESRLNELKSNLRLRVVRTLARRGHNHESKSEYMN